MPGPEAELTKCLDRRGTHFGVTQNADFGGSDFGHFWGGVEKWGFWASLYTTV